MTDKPKAKQFYADDFWRAVIWGYAPYNESSLRHYDISLDAKKKPIINWNAPKIVELKTKPWTEIIPLSSSGSLYQVVSDVLGAEVLPPRGHASPTQHALQTYFQLNLLENRPRYRPAMTERGRELVHAMAQARPSETLRRCHNVYLWKYLIKVIPKDSWTFILEEIPGHMRPVIVGMLQAQQANRYIIPGSYLHLVDRDCDD